MLERIDQSLFLFLNSLNSPFLDQVMWIISAKLTWLPLYLGALALIGMKQWRKLLIIIPVLVLAITITDQLTVHAFKEVFERLRPCHEPDIEGLVHIVKGKCGGKYGFVSSHAANSFAFALYSLLLLRKRWYTVSIIIWASVVGYSRIYLGVHYPGDVICGALLGSLIGWLSWYFAAFLERKFWVENRK